MFTSNMGKASFFKTSVKFHKISQRHHIIDSNVKKKKSSDHETLRQINSHRLAIVICSIYFFHVHFAGLREFNYKLFDEFHYALMESQITS